MKKIIQKNIFFFLVAFFLIMPILLPVTIAQASIMDKVNVGQITSDELIGTDVGVDVYSGLDNNDPRIIIANVISIILGFLGIIAVVIVVMGGYEWMTSGGSDEKAKEGRKRIVNGTIGLMIILSAYGIAKFATDSILNSTVQTEYGPVNGENTPNVLKSDSMPAGWVPALKNVGP